MSWKTIVLKDECGDWNGGARVFCVPLYDITPDIKTSLQRKDYTTDELALLEKKLTVWKSMGMEMKEDQAVFSSSPFIHTIKPSCQCRERGVCEGGPEHCKCAAIFYQKAVSSLKKACEYCRLDKDGVQYVKLVLPPPVAAAAAAEAAASSATVHPMRIGAAAAAASNDNGHVCVVKGCKFEYGSCIYCSKAGQNKPKLVSKKTKSKKASSSDEAAEAATSMRITRANFRKNRVL